MIRIFMIIFLFLEYKQIYSDKIITINKNLELNETDIFPTDRTKLENMKRDKLKMVPKLLCYNLKYLISDESINLIGKTDTEYAINISSRNMQNSYAWHNIEIRIIKIENWDNKSYGKDPKFWNGTLVWLADNIIMDGNVDYAVLIFVLNWISDEKEGKYELGRAYVKAMCTKHGLGVIRFNDHEAKYNYRLGVTIAHELGHILGLDHVEDDDSCKCPFEKCIMQPHSFSSIYKFPAPTFHDCSIAKLMEIGYQCANCKKIDTTVHSCRSGVSTSLTGNYECNCGPYYICEKRGVSKCCDSNTCTLTPISECSNELCCENCKFKTGPVCRKKKDPYCDLTDYCTADNKACDFDYTVADGQSCLRGYCYNGICTDKDYTCQKLLEDDTAKYSNDCHESLIDEAKNICHNRKEEIKKDTDFICKFKGKCTPIICETTKEPIVSVSEIIINRNDIRKICYYFNRNNYETPEGTSCGDGNICIGGECVSNSEYALKCQRCKANEVCDNTGHCVKNR